MKKISAYKAACILLLLNLLLIIGLLLIKAPNIRMLCFIVLLLISLAAVLWVLLPLRRIYEFFHRPPDLSEQSDSPACAEEALIHRHLSDIHAKTAVLERSLSEQNIDSLSRQINSHFFYNTLDSIRGRAFCDGAYVAADMIETLSAFFRYSISQNGNVVSIHDELMNLNAYMKIQMFRFGNRFDYDVTLNVKEVEKYQIPKLTLQPIVENSIIHGIEDYENGGIIKVDILETDSTIVIHVKDNGIGISAERLNQINQNFADNYFENSETQKTHLNIALNNINNRICLLYGKNYHLHIFSTEHVGTDVQITLPKIIHEKEGLS